MPAAIILRQGLTVGDAGKALLVQLNTLVQCTCDGSASSYLWTLLDVPVRSLLTRGTTGIDPTFSFTPDVVGTYLVSLKTNNSALAADNTTNIAFILTSGTNRMGWRYKAAGESQEDSRTATDLSGGSLNFPNNVNTRGWATQDDIEREQIEKSVYEVNTALSNGKLIRVKSSTGLIDSAYLPPQAAQPFNFVQNAPATTWVVAHGLGRYPSIVIVDSDGAEVIGDVVHNTNNQATLTFSEAITGIAVCN